jgi:hypothetical protein
VPWKPALFVFLAHANQLMGRARCTSSINVPVVRLAVY